MHIYIYILSVYIYILSVYIYTYCTLFMEWIEYGKIANITTKIWEYGNENYIIP